MALVAALGLMMLAAGLLAGTALASVGLQHAAHTQAAAARAESELRRGQALVLQGWTAQLDSIPIGAVVDRGASPIVLDGWPVVVRTRIRRLGPALYTAVVAVQVGDSTAPVAMRRARLLLTRPSDAAPLGAQGAAQSDVRPVAPWTITDLP